MSKNKYDKFMLKIYDPEISQLKLKNIIERLDQPNISSEEIELLVDAFFKIYTKEKWVLKIEVVD